MFLLRSRKLEQVLAEVEKAEKMAAKEEDPVQAAYLIGAVNGMIWAADRKFSWDPTDAYDLTRPVPGK